MAVDISDSVREEAKAMGLNIMLCLLLGEKNMYVPLSVTSKKPCSESWIII